MLKSYLYMRDISATVERINTYGCPLLFAARNSHPHLKQFNICIGEEFFDAAYQFNEIDSAQI